MLLVDDFLTLLESECIIYSYNVSHIRIGNYKITCSHALYCIYVDSRLIYDLTDMDYVHVKNGLLLFSNEYRQIGIPL